MIDFSDKTQLISFILAVAVAVCLLIGVIAVVATMKRRLSVGVYIVGLAVTIIVLLVGLCSCAVIVTGKTAIFGLSSVVDGTALVVKSGEKTLFTIDVVGAFFGVAFDKIVVELLVYASVIIDIVLLACVCIRRGISRLLYPACIDGEGYYTVSENQDVTETATEETVVEETPTEETTTEQPTEETVTEQPTAEETATEEAVEEAVTEEVVTEQAPTEEVATEEAIEEVATEEVVTEQAPPENIETEETTTENIETEEPIEESIEENKSADRAARFMEPMRATDKKADDGETVKTAVRVRAKSRAAAMFDDYLKGRSAEEREKLLGSIDTVTKKHD